MQVLGGIFKKQTYRYQLNNQGTANLPLFVELLPYI